MREVVGVGGACLLLSWFGYITCLYAL